MVNVRISHLLLVGWTLACTSAAASPPSTAARATTTLFDMQSNFWVNLHHFLYATARARRGLDAGRATITQSLADTSGAGTLSPAMRADWDAALAYYDRAVAERDILFDSSLVVVNDVLTNVRGPSLRETTLDTALVRALEQAAPGYRAVWWPRHDAANRRWIAAVLPLLAQHGDSAAAWEARIFGGAWAKEPVRVDVTAYANWAGAYTTEMPSHITIASLNEDTRGTAAFEILFHEVLHTMDGPLLERYRSAARAAGKRPLRNPTHPFIFYTAGEVTRQLFPGHVPYAKAVGLWTRVPDMRAMLPLLERSWQSWIADGTTLDAALRRIAVEL